MPLPPELRRPNPDNPKPEDPYAEKKTLAAEAIRAMMAGKPMPDAGNKQLGIGPTPAELKTEAAHNEQAALSYERYQQRERQEAKQQRKAAKHAKETETDTE